MSARILVVHDEEDICAILKFNLSKEGYDVVTANSAEEALALDAASFNLLLLDVMMGGMSGFELTRRLKSEPETAGIPVIFITARDTEDDAVEGLDLGADYYLTKPFGVMELVSCVKAVLRRCQPPQARRLSAGDICMDLDAHKVTSGGEPVTLTYKEYELLKLFLSHPGMVYSRDQLMEQVWGTDYCGETRTVDMHIRTLRQKLGPGGACIGTVRGVGYRLEANRS